MHLSQVYEKFFLFHHLYILIQSGLSLNRIGDFNQDCFRISGRLADMLNCIAVALGKEGKKLSDIMNEYPGYFTLYEHNVIQAGESEGKLPDSIKWLMELNAKEIERKRNSTFQLWYLGSISLMGFALVFLINLYVIPLFKDMYEGFGSALPLPTNYAFKTCTWEFSLLFIIVFCSIVIFLYKKYPEYCSHVMSYIPYIGKKWVFQESIRFSSVLGRSIESGVPPIDALNGAVGYVNHSYLKKKLLICSEMIQRGETWFQAFCQIKIFPKSILSFIQLGEKQGEIGQALSEIVHIESERFEYDWQIEKVLTWGIIVVLILYIAFLVFAMFLPLFSFASVIG